MRLKSLKLLPFLLFSLFAFACESGGDLKTDDNGTTEEPDTPITATIEVSEDAVKIPVAGDTHIVIVESSVSWKAESTGKEWITIFPSSGTAGETEVEIMVKNNESNRDRSADITFTTTTGKASAKVSVSQRWAYYFTLPCTSFLKSSSSNVTKYFSILSSFSA